MEPNMSQMTHTNVYIDVNLGITMCTVGTVRKRLEVA